MTQDRQQEAGEVEFLGRLQGVWRIEPADLDDSGVIGDLFGYLGQRAAVEDDQDATDRLLLKRIKWAVAAGAAMPLAMAIEEVATRLSAQPAFSSLVLERTGDPALATRLLVDAVALGAARDQGDEIDIDAALRRLSEITAQLRAASCPDRDQLESEAFRLLGQIVGAR